MSGHELDRYPRNDKVGMIGAAFHLAIIAAFLLSLVIWLLVHGFRWALS